MNGASMLVVDDNDALRTRLAAALVRRGLEVRVAATGEEGVRLAREASPEWALVDLRLPQMSGLEVVGELARLDPTTRIVVLSAYGSIPAALEAVRLGAIDFLQKPVSVDQVVATFERGGPEPVTGPGEVPTLARVEWEHLQRVLTDCGGNIRRAAKLLGLHRRTLQRKLAKDPVAR